MDSSKKVAFDLLGRFIQENKHPVDILSAAIDEGSVGGLEGLDRLVDAFQRITRLSEVLLAAAVFYKKSAEQRWVFRMNGGTYPQGPSHTTISSCGPSQLPTHSFPPSQTGFADDVGVEFGPLPGLGEAEHQELINDVLKSVAAMQTTATITASRPAVAATAYPLESVEGITKSPLNEIFGGATHVPHQPTTVKLPNFYDTQVGVEFENPHGPSVAKTSSGYRDKGKAKEVGSSSATSKAAQSDEVHDGRDSPAIAIPPSSLRNSTGSGTPPDVIAAPPSKRNYKRRRVDVEEDSCTADGPTPSSSTMGPPTQGKQAAKRKAEPKGKGSTRATKSPPSSSSSKAIGGTVPPTPFTAFVPMVYDPSVAKMKEVDDVVQNNTSVSHQVPESAPGTAVAQAENPPSQQIPQVGDPTPGNQPTTSTSPSLVPSFPAQPAVSRISQPTYPSSATPRTSATPEFIPPQVPPSVTDFRNFGIMGREPRQLPVSTSQPHHLHNVYWPYGYQGDVHIHGRSPYAPFAPSPLGTPPVATPPFHGDLVYEDGSSHGASSSGHSRQENPLMGIQPALFPPRNVQWTTSFHHHSSHMDENHNEEKDESH
ncbi:hypothetical protein ONZ45_g6152 [Pleurotus djamor]|nr:hypothetical protein ONZ45_g6152 [Pleurotus djamor]